jgi:protein O-GlcNAc transferase
MEGLISPYRVDYGACPLCGAQSDPLCQAEMAHPRGALPRTLSWLQCTGCGHQHTAHFWSPQGLEQLFCKTYGDQVFGGAIDEQRALWAPIVETALALNRNATTWVDVGVGNGALLFTAAEFGLQARGVDMRAVTVSAMREMGYDVELADAMTVNYRGADVVSLADLLEHVAYPKQLLRRIRLQIKPGGVLFISCPNTESVSWKAHERQGTNPYWAEPEHHHNFSRTRLYALLRECGFEPKRYGVSRRYAACMEVFAQAVAPEVPVGAGCAAYPIEIK